MPVLATLGASGLGAMASGISATAKGFQLGAKAKQAWGWLTNNGFSLTSGKWSLNKRKEAGSATFEIAQGLSGMSNTTLIGIAVLAYFLMKK